MTNPLNPQQDPRSLRDEAIAAFVDWRESDDADFDSSKDVFVGGYEAGVLAERKRKLTQEQRHSIVGCIQQMQSSVSHRDTGHWFNTITAADFDDCIDNIARALGKDVS